MVILSILIALIEIPVAMVEGVTHLCAGTLAYLRVQAHRNYDYRRWLKRDLADCETILELGCGSNSPILQIGYGQRTDAVDIWQPYIDTHRRMQHYKSCFAADLLSMQLSLKKYDAVVMLDVMEHLDRNEVIEKGLFLELEQCAAKKVVIFTPNGFIVNDEVDGDPFQIHRSAWEPSDFEAYGYKVKGATGLRWILGKATRPKWHPYSFWELIAMLSLPYIYNRPKLARHSYAVKELNDEHTARDK